MQPQRVERRLRLYYLAGQIFYLFRAFPKLLQDPQWHAGQHHCSDMGRSSSCAEQLHKKHRHDYGSNGEMQTE